MSAELKGAAEQLRDIRAELLERARGCAEKGEVGAAHSWRGHAASITRTLNAVARLTGTAL